LLPGLVPERLTEGVYGMIEDKHIVVIGGGFSGTALAVQLLREERAPLAVTIIEGRDALGQGLAYSTRDECHLLNTPNVSSSVIEDDVAHFQRWLWRSGQAAAADGFSARRDYSRYLQHTLDDAAAQASGWGSRLGTRLGRRATEIDRRHDEFRVRLDDGEVIDCTDVVIATGYAPPADPLAGMLPFDNRRYVRNPWQRALATEVPRTDSVLLVGTGLTMVDIALSLHRRGHRGTLHAVSRRGLLPRGHSAVAVSPPFDFRQRLYAALACDSLRHLLRAVRQGIAEAEAAGLGWQVVIDALRPLSHGIWRDLSEADRRRFLRHLRPYFDAHRHRVSPGPAGILASMVADGRLQIRAGRVIGAADCGDMILVKQQLRRKSTVRNDPYRWVINCTGATLAAVGAQSLEARLVAKGLLVADENGLGYECDRAGAVRGARGNVPGLYLIGPACRAGSFEHTAIPELRRHAAELARVITKRKARVLSSSWMPATVSAPQIQSPPWQRIAKRPNNLFRNNHGDLLR
jgi:uncharacterized NAD(P)/FAD-binding protein YdhS